MSHYYGPPQGNQQPTGGFPPQGGFQPMGSSRPGAPQEPRPFGVSIAAIAVAITGGAYFCLALFGLCGLSLTSSLTNMLSSPPYGSAASSSIVSALGLDSLILGILYWTALGLAHLYMSRGLWQLKSWAYWGVVGIEGFTILAQLIVLISNHNGGTFFASIYIPLLLVGYLLIIEEVRRTFRVPF